MLAKRLITLFAFVRDHALDVLLAESMSFKHGLHTLHDVLAGVPSFKRRAFES